MAPQLMVTQTDRQTDRHTYTHTHIHANAYTHTYIHTYTHTDTCTHTYTRACFILCLCHLQASRLLHVALSTGFRESGIVMVKKRILLKVRSNLRLELPVVTGQRTPGKNHRSILVGPDMLRHVVCDRKSTMIPRLAARAKGPERKKSLPSTKTTSYKAQILNILVVASALHPAMIFRYVWQTRSLN